MTMHASLMSGDKAFSPIEACTARFQSFHRCTFSLNMQPLFDGFRLKTLREKSKHGRQFQVRTREVQSLVFRVLRSASGLGFKGRATGQKYA